MTQCDISTLPQTYGMRINLSGHPQAHIWEYERLLGLQPGRATAARPAGVRHTGARPPLDDRIRGAPCPSRRVGSARGIQRVKRLGQHGPATDFEGDARPLNGAYD